MDRLGVTWTSNKKAWMTQALMSDWLHSFDKRLGRQRRKVLLFLDNATSHPDLKLKNVKLIFFPPNTTSHCQPLDQGIIQNFKIRYRRLILTRILAELEEISSADELAQKINVLDSVTWIQTAIRQIESTCVQNCFIKAGFPLIDATEETADDFLMSAENLMQQLPPHLQDRDYFSIDDHLCTEPDYVEDITHFIPSSTGNEHSDEEEEFDDTSLPLPPVSVVEARECMQKLQTFASQTDNVDIVLQLKHLQITFDNQALLSRRDLKQSKITAYF